MANNFKESTASRNAALDGRTALVNGGTIEIYDGSQPATPDTAVTTQVLLATLTFNATAFAAASSGSATANAITSGTAVATSTATWFRAKSSGGTARWDGTVGTSGCDLNLGSVSISTGLTVSITSFVISQP